MNARASFLATAFAFAATAAYASPADQSFDRTLNVGNSASVSVSTGSGSIHLSPGTKASDVIESAVCDKERQVTDMQFATTIL